MLHQIHINNIISSHRQANRHNRWTSKINREEKARKILALCSVQFVNYCSDLHLLLTLSHFCLDNSAEQKAEITSQETSDERKEQEFKDINIKEEVTEQKPVEEAEKRVNFN